MKTITPDSAMKSIYISGKIDGCDPTERFAKFTYARYKLEARFTNLLEGTCAFVVNPLEISAFPAGTWFDYMMRDLVYLKQCDTIYMLKDWKDSAGARIEHEFAKKLGLEIIYEEE